MKHRWKRAALALLLAGLFCVLLTGCELEEEEEVTINSWANLSGLSNNDDANISFESDSKGDYWTVTRTQTDTYVAKQLKKYNYCLYQLETKAVAPNGDVEEVSLQYVLNSPVYWNVLGGNTTDLGKENGLEKQSDTTDLRYVVITFDYEWSGGTYWPTQVTLRYGTETSKDQPLKGVIYETSYSMYDEVPKNKEFFDYVSGVRLDTVTTDATYNASNYSNTALLNTALKIVFDTNSENTIEVFQKNIRTLADSAMVAAEKLMDDTSQARWELASAAQEAASTTTNK